MFASLDAPLSAAPSPRPADPRAARLAKFKREQRIVEYLNRGVAVAEIAAQVGLSEKRMHAVVRDILDRRMPHPPKEFVAIQVSRLNEALLVAYSAMSLTNLKAVDQVVKIVRELDRYHGLSAVAGRRRFEPDALAAPDEATVAYGGAFVCRAEWAAADDEDLALAGADARPENPPEAIEKIDSAPGEIETSPATQNPLALPGLLTRGSRGEGRGEGPGRLAAESHPAPHPSLLPVNGEKGHVGASAGDGRPGFQLQAVERIDSVPGPFEAEALARAAGAARSPQGDAATEPAVERPAASGSPRPCGARDDGDGHATGPGVSTPPRPDHRPEFSPQAAEKIDSAPGRVEPEALAGTLVVASNSRFPGRDPGMIRLDTAIRPDVERRAASGSPRPTEARDDGEGHATEHGASPPRPEDRPEFSRPEFPLQAPEKIDSAPGKSEPSEAAPAAPAEFPVIRMPILTSTGLKFVNARRTPNGMTAC